MTQLCVVSTLLGAATVAAAIDAGTLPPPAEGERLLLVANTAEAPEIVASWHETPGARAILSRFDRVIRLDELLHPYHPAKWEPLDDELPVLDKMLRSHWRLGDGAVELFVESVHQPPAATLARILRGGPVTVVPAALMAYGPTPGRAPLHVVQVLRGLIYADLVPGLRPLFLSEDSVAAHPIGADAIKRVLAEVVSAVGDADEPLPDFSDTPTSLVLGAHLSAGGLFTRDEEDGLHEEMVDAALGSGATRIAFKPHPFASLAITELVRRRTASRGAEFALLDTDYPAEMIAEATRVHSVVGCGSAELVALVALAAVPAISVGSDRLLARIAPFQSADRMPATIVDALARPDGALRETAQLQPLVESVGYAMQPNLLAGVKPAAERFVAEVPEAERDRYLRRQRLVAVGLIPDEALGAKALRRASEGGVGGTLRGLLGKKGPRP